MLSSWMRFRLTNKDRLSNDDTVLAIAGMRTTLGVFMTRVVRLSRWVALERGTYV